jgi:multidrug efflux pump subunit AcrA (membrane-fusion protein)
MNTNPVFIALGIAAVFLAGSCHIYESYEAKEKERNHISENEQLRAELAEKERKHVLDNNRLKAELAERQRKISEQEDVVSKQNEMIQKYEEARRQILADLSDTEKVREMIKPVNEMWERRLQDQKILYEFQLELLMSLGTAKDNPYPLGITRVPYKGYVLDVSKTLRSDGSPGWILGVSIVSVPAHPAN